MSLLLLFPVLELWFLNDHSSRPDRFLPAVGSIVDTDNPWTLLEKLGNPIGMFTYESRLVENTVFDWNYPGLTYLNDAISSLRKSGKPVVYHSVKKNILHMLNFSLFEFVWIKIGSRYWGNETGFCEVGCKHQRPGFPPKIGIFLANNNIYFSNIFFILFFIEILQRKPVVVVF